MSLPNTKGEEITARLEILSKRSEVTPFEVRSLKKDIEKLASVNAAESFMLGGMLAAIIGDYVESKELHEKSLRLVSDEVTCFNFGISMKTLGDLTLAKKMFNKVAEKVPGNSELLAHRLQTMAFLLDYGSLDTILADYKRANPAVDVEVIQPVCDARRFIRRAEDLKISMDQLSRVGLHIEHALLKHDLSVGRMLEKLSSFDGVGHIYLELSVDAVSAVQLVQVNEYLMDLILADSHIESWDRIVVNIIRREHESVENNAA